MTDELMMNRIKSKDDIKDIKVILSRLELPLLVNSSSISSCLVVQLLCDGLQFFWGTMLSH